MLSQRSKVCLGPLSGHREGEVVNREASTDIQALLLITNKME